MARIQSKQNGKFYIRKDLFCFCVGGRLSLSEGNGSSERKNKQRRIFFDFVLYIILLLNKSD